MAGLYGSVKQPTLREGSVKGNTWADDIDKLDADEWRLPGSTLLPQRDGNEIQANILAIMQGQHDYDGKGAERVQKLMKRNPYSASMFAQAAAQYDAVKRQSASRAETVGNYIRPAKEFTGEGEGLGFMPVGGILPEKRNPQGLVDELVRQGDMAGAKEISALYGVKQPVKNPMSLSSVHLGAAMENPEAYDPLGLVDKLGVDGARDFYKKGYNNAKSLERVTGPSGTTELSERTGAKGRTDFKIVHDDARKIIEDHAKLQTLQSGMDELDKLIEKDESSVKDAVGYWRNTTLSNWVKSDKAKEAVAQISKIKAEVIRKNAGLTQTAAELERVTEMLASSAQFSAEDFIKAFRLLQNTYATEYRMLFNRAGADAKDIAAKRIGVDPDNTPWETRRKNKKPSSGDIGGGWKVKVK